ncbi:MAG: SpaA isopeptide-forming pilin-related protein [Eubacteriales bacterium]|nr:SpaA isopeptide-forming pilin-related protein [Eubacteriales bacterium]
MKKQLMCFFLAAAISAVPITAPVIASDTEAAEEQYAAEEPEMDVVFPEEPEQGTEVSYDDETPPASGCFTVQTSADHGQIILNGNRNSYAEMEKVEFVVVPDEGYEVGNVYAESADGFVEIQILGDEQYEFFMPADNVRITASLVLKQENAEKEDTKKENTKQENTGQDREQADQEADITVEEETMETISPEEFDFTIISGEDADLIQAETPETEEFLEEIKEGQIIALAPIQNTTMKSAEIVMSTAEDGIVSLAAETSPFTMNMLGYVNMDEIWVNDGGSSHHMGTVCREIVYTDDEGVSHRAPVYCMNPMKNGPLEPSMTIKEEAIKILSNSSIKKILYYGYGGPGDITNTYDPTCSHCDWSKAANRYVLTHFALSKVYSNDVAGATAAECEHVGLDRWISKLTSMTFPNMKDLKFYGKDSNGDMVSAKDMVGNLTYFKVVPDSLSWCGMGSGVQISSTYILTSTMEKNGITFTCRTSDAWTMGYWTSADDYTARGQTNPRVLGKGKSVTLYKGARIRYAFPYTTTSNQKLTFASVLKPVEYIAINASIQTNQSNMQDLGTYFFEGDREQLSLTFRPAASGTVVLKKVADQNPDKKIQGAGYRLIAAENIVSNGATVLKKDERMSGGHTDKNGELTFSYVPIGKYYLLEVNTKAGSEAEKYLIDVTKHQVTVTKNAVKTVTVREIPDMSGKVSIRKVIKGTELDLTGAEFTLYTWSKKTQKYTNGVKLQYNTSSKRYESGTVTYSSDNQGKFMVKETKNPKGFTGTFSKKFVLTKLGQKELFGFTAENDSSPRRVEIIKLDAVTREILDNAEFAIFEWDNVRQAYKSIGEPLTFDPETERYYSKELEITDRNMGRYKIEETRVPEGYTGEFEREINLYAGDTELQFTVENIPVTLLKGRIRIKKTDSITGESLSGAEFCIYQYNTLTDSYENTLGDLSKLSYDEESQIYCSEELTIDSNNNGRFRVIETKAPTGYNGSWKKEFVLTEENPEPEPFEAVNDPDRPPLAEITVVKKVKENEIVWAHGNPVFSFVVEGKDSKGSSRKYENYVSFSQDGYTVDANGYAVMQITFHNVPVGQYQVYEKPALYYYLEDSIANTANVSIVKGAAPSYGQLPKAIAYGNVRLTAAENKASITFVNKKARYDHYIHNDVVRNRIPVTFQ